MLALTALTASIWPLGACAAEPEQALFWRVRTPGDNAHIIFGGTLITASLVPDIVSDCKRLIDETQRVIVDVPNVTLPAFDVEYKDHVPILKRLSRPTADELRSVLAAIPAVPPVDKIPGILAVQLLLGEGTDQGTPVLGDVLAQHVQLRRRPVSFLVTEKEILEQFFHTPDIAALDKNVDEAKIKRLLDLRRNVGPLGAYGEQLYRARRGEELAGLAADITRSGMLFPSPFSSEQDAIRFQIVVLDRLKAQLSYAADAPPAFVILPASKLGGRTGILSALNNLGFGVTPIA
jgi:hypothetical protein